MQPAARGWLTGLAYLATAAIVYAGWSLHELRLVVPSQGLGYALGILGSTLMVLLLLYPLRKRARFLRNAGPIRHWFRIHMMLGIVGPVLVLFHSNFALGSINSQVALFCTITVAVSGIFGRYLYAKVHDGLYGQRMNLQSVRSEIDQSRTNSSALGSLLPIINDRLSPLEAQVNDKPVGLLAACSHAVTATLVLMWLKLSLRSALAKELRRLSKTSAVIRSNNKRLRVNTFRYLNYRLAVLRKFAQLQACERLFSLWHVVHYPLFMVLVVAAIVHIVAVHMY